MRKLLALAAGAVLLGACSGNDDKSTWEEYADWREANNAWLAQQQKRLNPDGTPYYNTVVPAWNPGSFVLIHYFNDREETAGNLTPLYTSTVDTRYFLHLYNGTPVDSSTLANSGGAPGVYRARVNTLIPGWSVALSQMHCGDTCEVIIPYQLGYGASSSGVMKPYSNLVFNIRLVDIYRYEASPY